jgi:TolA-binding protein
MKAEVAGSYVAEGLNDQVVAECESILAENPPDSWAQYLMYLLGSAQIGMGRNAEAVLTFDRLMEKYPKGEWSEAAEVRVKALLEQGGDGR